MPDQHGNKTSDELHKEVESDIADPSRHYHHAGQISVGPPRHNEVSSTILRGGKAYNISSGDNDRQMTMTQEEQERVAKKRGYGKEYKDISSAVSAAISESKAAADPKKAVEMYIEHQGRRK
jgi:hypothetical protein